MGADAAVEGNGRPAVGQDLHLWRSSVDHRFDSQHHSGLESRTLAAGAEVGYLGILVHGSADAVADELLDDAETLGLAHLLDGGGYVA